MKTKKNTKGLVKHVIASEASQSQSHGVSRHCEEGKHSAARRSNLCRALTNSCSSLRSHNCILSKQGEELCDQFPLQLERARERVGFNHSGTPQSLIKVKNLST